mmetsp:Transcript_17398/g.48327  ORF Transcript_17398/g.48327 Transcript_17398/m.48327 type:complete len:217 (-) Transcript_17398:603-1253(-)
MATRSPACSSMRAMRALPLARSTRYEVRTSGPCKSMIVAMQRPASEAICLRFVSVSACVVGVAWLNLKRAMSMPAATRACSVSGLRLAGPMVAAILVLRTGSARSLVIMSIDTTVDLIVSVLWMSLGSCALMTGANDPKASMSRVPGAIVTNSSRRSKRSDSRKALDATKVEDSTTTSLPALHRPFSTPYCSAFFRMPGISPTLLMGSDSIMACIA